MVVPLFEELFERWVLEKEQMRGFVECADRESNPGYELGKLMSYH